MAKVMRGALPSTDFWKGQRVLLTGHTGFKGGWTAVWLRRLGADLCGYSLPPPTTPSLFEAAALGDLGRSVIGDIRDLSRLRQAFEDFDPTIVIHMAAQPLVRHSYAEPLETYSVNVMGTAHVLDLARARPGIKATLIVTTDKCYENLEQSLPYSETDRLGGRDPYSSSKACAELVMSSYWWSFFRELNGQGLGSVRAGNVIGGGDWSQDRLVPDLVAAFAEGRSAVLRRPESVRPWQHVLEPICGYLLAVEHIAQRAHAAPPSWNFGPEPEGHAKVAAVAGLLARAWGDGANYQAPHRTEGPHEANLLVLDHGKAKAELGWRPRWSLPEAVEHTAVWYRAFHDGADMRDCTQAQLTDYLAS